MSKRHQAILTANARLRRENGTFTGIKLVEKGLHVLGSTCGPKIAEASQDAITFRRVGSSWWVPCPIEGRVNNWEIWIV